MKKLWFVDFNNADLYGADLWLADCYSVDFRCADMRFTDLRKTDMRKADFRKANLQGADLTGANLEDADFTGANIQGIIVGAYTNLKNVKGLSKDQLKNFNKIIVEKTAIAVEEKKRQIEFIRSIPDKIFYIPEKIVSLLLYVPKRVALKIINRFYGAQSN